MFGSTDNPVDTLFPNLEVLESHDLADPMNGEKESALAISQPTFVHVDDLLTKSGISHCGELFLPAFLVQDGAGQLVYDSLCRCDARIGEQTAAVESNLELPRQFSPVKRTSTIPHSIFSLTLCSSLQQ